MIQFIVNGMCAGAIIALVALGFGLIYTTTRVFHVAHASVYVFGGYALWLASTKMMMPLAFAIACALIVAALSGVLVEWLVYQPLARQAASSAVVLITSVGIHIVGENTVSLAFGNEPRILKRGIDSTAVIGTIILSYVQIAQLVAGAIAIAGFWIFLKHTRLGRICRAVSDDETLARVLGVNVTLLRLTVFAVGSAFAGAGAVLVTLDVGLDPHVGFPAFLAAAVACIVGGLRNFMAPALGGLILGVTQSMVVWRTSSKWESAVTFSLLIIFLLFRRQGLLGEHQRAEEV